VPAQHQMGKLGIVTAAGTERGDADRDQQLAGRGRGLAGGGGALAGPGG